LAKRGKRLAASSRSAAEARSAVDAATQALTVASRRLADEVQRRLTAQQRLEAIRTVYERNSFRGQVDNPDATQTLILAEREQLARLERALFILEASSAIDRVATLESRAAALRERVDRESAKLTEAQQAVELARQIDATSIAVANQILAEQFDTVMPLLKELYRRLRPHADWTEIESDFGGKVRVSLNLTVGEGHNVQFLFSSGQRRAAGLAFLLAIHLSRRWCQLQSLLLDDPVQHIDDYRALNLVEVLAAIRRSGRQIIVAVEDPALADLLSRRLRRLDWRNRAAIRTSDFENGNLRDCKRPGYLSHAARGLAAGRTSLMQPATAGRQLYPARSRQRIALEGNRFDATKAGITLRLRNERPSAPALRLLEPHALAAVANIAWLEEYDPRLLERPLKCLKRACPRIGSPALDILDRDLGYPRRFCQIDLCPPDQGARRPNLPRRDHGRMLHLGNHL